MEISDQTLFYWSGITIYGNKSDQNFKKSDQNPKFPPEISLKSIKSTEKEEGISCGK